jgi:hypothetical protein
MSPYHAPQPRWRATRGKDIVQRRIVDSSIAIVLLVGACSGRSGPSVSPVPRASISPIPADALPGSAAASVQIDASTLAVDAADVAGLRALLDDSGFLVGTQRLFSRVRHGRRRLVARVLIFGSRSGAGEYLGWLGDHIGEVIGEAEPRGDLAIPEGAVYEHQPSPCCHNDTRIFLAAWERRDNVLTLEIGGQGARASDVIELVRQLDTAV